LPLLLGGLTLGFWATPGHASPPSDAASSEAKPVERQPASQLWSPGALDPDAGLPGRAARELERRRQILRSERGSPAAAIGVLGAVVELDGEVPRGQLQAMLDGVIADKRRDAGVRALAEYERARLDEASGSHDDARKRYERLGHLLRWRMVGPFEGPIIEVGTGPAAEPYDANQSFTGKVPNEPLRWHVHHPYDALPGGYVSFDETMHPNVKVTGWATTWVYVAKKQTAVLHLGTGGPYRAFVQGAMVGASDVSRRVPDPLQDAWEIQLDKGWNRVAVAVAADESMWGFFARISQRSGAAIPGLRISARPEDHPDEAFPVDVLRPGEDRTSKPGRSLRTALEERARKRAADQMPLVRFYRWVRPFDSDDPTDVRAARRADTTLQSAESAWMLAILEPDQNDSRSALEDAIARAKKAGKRSLLGELYLDLSWRYRALGLERRSKQALEQARAAAPDDVVIELAAVDRLADDGFRLAAVDWAANIAARYPDSVSVQREYAGRLMDLGRVRRGLGMLEALAKRGYADGAVNSARIRAHLVLGELEAAVKLGERMVMASPGRPGLRRDLAALYEAQGDVAAATAALDSAIELAPLDAELYSGKGRLLARAGQGETSVLAFKRSLELKPQQPDVRDLLASTQGGDFFDENALDLEAVAKAADAQPTPASWADEDAAVLHHLIAQRVSENGLGERIDQRIIRVLDERGVRSQAVQGTVYDPAQSYVEVRRARVRRASGEIEDLGRVRVRSIAAAGYRMYYDQRQVAVEFEGPRVGDTVEVAFVRRDVAARNLFDDYYGDVVPLMDSVPIRKLEYRLEAPASMTLNFNRAVETTEPGAEGGEIGRRRYRLVREDVPALEGEASMPGWTEVAEYLHVSTYDSWDAVARWYWDLVDEQLVVDDEIRAGVARAIEPLPRDASVEDKVGAIYEHVVRSTRYVGLEFGIHGYKPYRTTDVYDRRFGDCKDKASLLKVMLAEVGIKSHLVLVRTRDQGRIERSPASLSAFNHAIVYVPELDRFLDGTAEWSGPTELPANDQGASVLIVRDGEGGDFRTIPMSGAVDNGSFVTQHVRLRADGSADVDYEMEVRGSGANAWRARYQAPDEQVERLTKTLAGRYPGVEVTQAQMKDIDSILAPVRVEAKLVLPTFAQPEADDRLRFRAIGHDAGMTRSLGAQQKRRHPLVLPTPSTETRTILYSLPGSHRFAKLPESRSFGIEQARFELAVEGQGDGKATVSTRLELLDNTIDPEQYREFREFLRQVDAALEQTFEVEKRR
jgi:tetratricopeptide (TPR) repeat protein